MDIAIVGVNIILFTQQLIVFFPCPAVKEAAVQRRHNLYRDSIVLSNSDPNLHLLGESSPVDWATKFGGDEMEGPIDSGTAGGGSAKKRKQIVSMIQMDGVPLPYESCLEVPGVELIPEEDAEVSEGKQKEEGVEKDLGPPEDPKSPDSVDEIRDLINPVVEMVLPVHKEDRSDTTNGTKTTGDTITTEEQVTHVTAGVEDVPRKPPRDKASAETILQQLVGSKKQEADEKQQEEAAIKNAIEEIEIAVQEEDNEQITEVNSHSESPSPSPPPTDSSSHLNGSEKIIDPVDVEVILA